MNDNVTPIRPASEEKPHRARRKRGSVNVALMPSNLRLSLALDGVSAALEHACIIDGLDVEMQDGLATAAAILARMLRESLTNQGII